jgi:hypothetical protein
MQCLKKTGITISIDGKGGATDNICIDRFWRSVKCEKFYQTLNYKKTNEYVPKKYKIKPENEGGFLGFFI